MKKVILLIAWVLIPIFCIAQDTFFDVSKKNSSEKFVEIVKHAQDSVFDSIVRAYSNYLDKNLSDSRTFVEKCKFIENAFFEEDEYYNPKYVEHEECLDSLIQRFPNDSFSIIYYNYDKYTDSSVVAVEALIEGISSGVIEKEPENIWMAYEKLAYHYSSEEGFVGRTIALAYDAMKANEELDLSILMANQYKELGEKDKAVNILLQYMDSTVSSGQFYSKGELFFELESYENAHKAYLWSVETEEGWDLAAEIGAVLVKLEKFDEARPYLVEASFTDWEKRKALEQLLIYDLKHSPVDSAISSYNQMRAEGFLSDPFGIYRAKLLINKKVFWLGFSDFLFLFSYVLLVIIIVLVPYVWILPIYSYGSWRGTYARENILEDRWQISHFWFFSSLFLFSSLITQIILDYSEVLVLFNGEYSEDAASNGLMIANSILLFDFIMIIGMVAILRFKDIVKIVGVEKTWVHQLIIGIAAFIFFRIGYGLVHTIFSSVFKEPEVGFMASMLETGIIGMIEHYGVLLPFLLVVITGPILEEIQFRGIILGATSKYVPFWVANVIQSLLFVLVHEELSLFLFYIIFGLTTGYLRKSTGGYIAPMVLHILNNGIVFMRIWYSI